MLNIRQHVAPCRCESATCWIRFPSPAPPFIHAVLRAMRAGKRAKRDTKRPSRKVIDILALARWGMKPENPFRDGAVLISPCTIVRKPYAGRIHALWSAMRNAVVESFPSPPPERPSREAHFQNAKEIYKRDAYNSLSIEGCVVTPGLIEKICAGALNRATEEGRRQQGAMAAKGYFLAHQAVLASAARIFDGENPGKVADRGLQTRYTQLHQPPVDAGLIPAYSLAGYTASGVYSFETRFTCRRLAKPCRTQWKHSLRCLQPKTIPPSGESRDISHSFSFIPARTATAASGDF